MNAIAEILKGTLMAVLFIAILACIVIVSVCFGYLVGMFIAIIPFVSDLLVQGTGIDKSEIPTYTAWFAVAGLFIGGGKATGNAKEVAQDE